MDKKISELDQVLQINNDAVFPMSQDSGGTPTTYKASITQLGAEIGEDQTFSNLQTTDKTLVGAINEVAQGGGGGGSSNANIAPDYDATSTYAVGDWCIYNGTLYQCNTAIPIAEAFDPTHWTAKKVVDAFADIEDELNDKVDTTDFYATNLPIESGSSTNTKDYIDNSINAPIKASEVVSIPNGDLAVGSNWSEGCSYVKRNGLIILHLALQGLTASTRNDVYTLPTNCRPSLQIVGAGMGGNSYTAFAQATITTGGVVQVSSVDTYARIHLMYYVNE